MSIFEIIDGRPLTDPELVRRVLRDTIPGPGREVELGFLLCDLNGHLVTPIILPMASIPTDPAVVRAILEATVGTLGSLGSVASLVVRHGPVHARPEDRAWQTAVEDYCRETGVQDLGFFVMGTRGIDHVLPTAAEV